MWLVFIGMGLQAFATSLLESLELIDASAGQQFIAGILFLVTGTIAYFLEKQSVLIIEETDDAHSPH